MTVLRALIVDDSRTAQYRLKKLLDRYEVEIDLATSAEEALGYLSYKMPTVIFMDHHMEGMDGLAALKILKANPTTATIPVIMYTSKSDELYAGQAHALGALDTLSKSLMKPERVEEVLAKLRIYPADQAEHRSPADGETLLEVTHHGEEPPYSPEEQNKQIDAAELKTQVARLFELHIADVRTQISENTKFVVRRLADEIKNSSHQHEKDNDTPQVDASNDDDEYAPQKPNVSSNWMLGLIFVVLGAISIQVYQGGKQTRELRDAYAAVVESNQQSNALLDSVLAISGAEEIGLPSQVNYIKLLDALSWALSVDMHFDYNQAPLNDSHILNLQTLTFHLQEAGFRGFVEIDIRLGNYCLKQAEGGDWVLPSPNSPLNECSLQSEQRLDLSAENYTSLAYLQFEQTAAPILNGDIEFMIEVSAFENPMYPYPDRLTTTTAGQWNAVAAKNQQVVMSVEAEDYIISAK